MRNLILLLVIPLFLSLASSAESENYSVDSFTESASGGNASGSSYAGDYAFIYQQGIGSAEGSTYSAEYTLSSTENISAVAGGNETTNVTNATTTAGGGGGGCTYEWVCTEWYPEPCPSDGIQKRLCVNRGSCSGTEGIPESERNCVYVEPIGPLFDFFANIPVSHKVITAGSVLKADLELVNIGDIETLDVFFKYWIIDENNSLITELQETRAIAEGKKFEAYIVLPKSMPTGTYRFFVQITYDDGKTAVAEDSFEIISRKFYILSALGILFLIAVLIILVLYLRKRKHQIKSIHKREGKKKRNGKERTLTDYKRRIRKAIEKHKNKPTYNKKWIKKKKR